MQFTSSEESFIELLVAYMESEKRPNSIFIAGGFIRDKLLNKKPKDMDIIVTKKYYKHLSTHLKKLSFKDKRIQLDKGKPAYGYGYPKNRDMFCLRFEGVEVEIRSFMEDLKTDLLTRDFTVNSLFYDLTDSKLIDLVGVR